MKFFKVNSLPAVRKHLVSNLYVDNALDEAISVRSSLKNNFNNHWSINISHMLVKSEPTNNNHVVATAYDDSLSENEKKTWSVNGIW